MKNRALLISGGGAYGAWGGGLAEKLSQFYDYNLIVGTSTGALLAPLIALKKFNKLKEAYTSVNQKDIFDVNPFNKKGNISLFNTIIRLIQNKKTLGESNNLRKLISKFFTEEDYLEIKEKNIEVGVSVYNLTCKRVFYKFVSNETYNDFCDWMWISANVPLFMSIVEKEKSFYCDGGVVDIIPILKNNKNITDIDVIIHHYKSNHNNYEIKNIFSYFTSIIKAMNKEILYDDLLKLVQNKDINCKQYFLNDFIERKGFSELIFNKELMLKWWEIGFNEKINEKYNI